MGLRRCWGERWSFGYRYGRLGYANLMIMDINMPGITGYEAILVLKGNSWNTGIPIMALRANKTTEGRGQSYEMGCEGYILKPIIDVE